MARPRPAASPAFEVGERVAWQAAVRPWPRDPRAPAVRPLRIYTLDPSVSARQGGVATVPVPWEPLGPGPVGALFRVDPAGAPPGLRAGPLDLDDPRLLLSDGLAPTPADGRFHLQMVYAVASLTWAAFRRALGRDVGWAFAAPAGEPARLVLRPFGFRGANAGFSREAGAIAFGYFRAGRAPAGFTVPGGLICTALSHDIVVHETAHALLDGLRAAFLMPTGVDVPAFHEGFADLVALFLHFTYTDVVEQAIGAGPGAFARGSVLTDLAREFGHARSRDGRAAALRSGVDVEGVAAFDSDIPPGAAGGPRRYDPDREAHALGSVLVSAVFEAFATIVRRKTERYFRLAGLDPEAPAPRSEALVRALAREAGDVAAQFLNVCIRAIDYCPPADLELGEYLRALITADAELERADRWGFREALMRSFRRRHLFPDHVPFMTEDAVRWQPPAAELRVPGLAFRHLRFEGDPGRPASAAELGRQARALGRFVTDPRHAAHFHLVVPGQRPPRGVVQAPPPMVQSVRAARRVAPDGSVVFDLVAEVTQTCTVRHGGELFEVPGGCTVVIDPDGRIRYVIYKRFDSEARRARQHAAMRGPLRAFWRRDGRRYRLRAGNILLRIHAAAAG